MQPIIHTLDHWLLSYGCIAHLVIRAEGVRVDSSMLGRFPPGEVFGANGIGSCNSSHNTQPQRQKSCDIWAVA